MCRWHGRAGANVRFGSNPIPSRSAGSCSLMKPGSTPKWPACEGVVPEAGGWSTIPHDHWKTMTFIAGLRCDGLTAPWVIEGAMDSDAFERYIETQLAPTLQKGGVVVLDNLPAHKRDEARRAVERRGAWLLFLPPYSPDFNPIKLAFLKFKAHMKRLKPRTVDDLW